VLVADDDFATAAGLGKLLSREYEVVAELERLADLLVEVERLNPDVVVVDIQYRKEGDALDVIRLGKANGTFRCPFVVHSMHDSAERVRDAFKVGAAGFVAKGDDLAQLLTTVSAALRGERVIPEWMKKHSAPVSKGGRKVRSDRILIDDIPFTVAEVEVLLALYEGKSNAQIGRYLGMKASSVGFHITSLRRKIGIREKALLVRWVSDRQTALREAIRPH